MKLNDVFLSINGEINLFHQGSLCIFVRFQGCNMRCKWCDTPQAQEIDNGTEDVSIGQIIEKMNEVAPRCRKVTITGGEPLIHGKPMIDYIESLLKRGYCVSVETNGSFPTRDWLHPEIRNHPNLSFVVDWKLPDSGMSQNMEIANFRTLTRKDFVKFVISSRKDYDEAVRQMGMMALMQIPVTFAMSANTQAIMPRWELLEWMFADQIPAVFNFQLHKYLDGLK